jgi:hypothetical protein
MPIAPGTHIGPYEVVDAIGAGAMGEVYRATDSNLKRDVAIKVLPSALAHDAERLARFQREAEALAALNHAFIATIHGIEESGGIKALVMELVEGPTLAERLHGGALTVDESVSIAHQIAEALEAAHERGIIHRDLKPDNIKLRPDGTVKVLDFGIAKFVDTAAASTAGSSPELTMGEMTRAGTVLGTAAYMSPEQARGQAIDKRSDIWAFGAVLYEMLTGSRAFEGEDATDTMAAILRSEPDWGRLPAGLSPSVRTYLQRCLRKEPRQRIHDIADMRLALEGAFDAIHTGDGEHATTSRNSWRGLLLITAAVALLAVGFLLAELSGFVRPADVDAVPMQGARFAFVPPPDLAVGDLWLTGTRLAITPDGGQLVYAVGGGGLAARSISDSLTVTRLSNEGFLPIVSPDSEWIAFRVLDVFRRIRVSGGSSFEITESIGRNMRGGSWGEDGNIVFADDRGLFVVPADGGTPKLLAEPNQAAGEYVFASPRLLPGIDAVLFAVIPQDPNRDPIVATLNLATGERATLFRGGISPRYLSTGHIVYVSDGRLQARSFDIETFAVGTDPVTLSDVPINLTPEGNEAMFDVSSTGTLVYIPQAPAGGNAAAGATLFWVDRDGNEEELPLPPAGYHYQNVSPDGSMVTMTVGGEGRNIYSLDLARNNVRPLEINSSEDVISIWNQDGSEILFASSRDAPAPMRIYARSADGTGRARRLFEGELAQWPWEVTTDGTQLIILNGDDIARLFLSDPPRLENLLTDEGMQFKPDLSPNQDWLVYQSNETGRFEIYVVPYPEVDRLKLKVSIDGGDDAQWSNDGREIFYRTYDGAMVAVPVTYTTNDIVLGEPTRLFDAPEPRYTGNVVRGPSYDVSPADGRFLMVRGSAPPSAEIVVWQNWFAEVGKMVPTR